MGLGWFWSCDEVCQVHKREWEAAKTELRALESQAEATQRKANAVLGLTSTYGKERGRQGKRRGREAWLTGRLAVAGVRCGRGQEPVLAVVRGGQEVWAAADHVVRGRGRRTTAS